MENSLEPEIHQLLKEADLVIQGLSRVKEDPAVLARTISLLNKMGAVQETLENNLKRIEGRLQD